MSATQKRVLSVNVGGPRTVQTSKGSVTTGIWKTPAAGRVRAHGTNLDGDVQVDRHNHGGPHKAIYAYAADDLAYWEQHLGRPLGPGSLGENLTISGIDPNTALIGERWAIGSTLLERYPNHARLVIGWPCATVSRNWFVPSWSPSGRALTCASSSPAISAPATQSRSSGGQSTTSPSAWRSRPGSSTAA